MQASGIDVEDDDGNRRDKRGIRDVRCSGEVVRGSSRRELHNAVRLPCEMTTGLRLSGVREIQVGWRWSFVGRGGGVPSC